MPSFNFQIATPFGPSSFTVEYSTAGKVTKLVSSAASLSPTMLKLSFGDRAELAGNYFAALTDNLRYQLEIVPFIDGVPDYLKMINASFAGHRLADDNLFVLADPEVLLRLHFWERYGKLREALFFQPNLLDAVLQRFAGNAKRWTREGTDTRAALEPWVLTLFDLADAGSIHLVWEILGRIATASAANRMLSELESPGIHPQSTAILKGLAHAFTPERDGDRLLALGIRQEYSEALARPYLRIVERVISPKAVSVAKHLLFQQVEAAPEALRIFQNNGVEDPLSIAKEAFWETEVLWVTYRYVELFQDNAPPEQRITLSELNQKLSAPFFTDSAPVIWQQQLSEAWKGLLRDTDLEESLSLIEEYALRPEARLKYNALLQLNFLLNSAPATAPSPGMLRGLQKLVSHRFDKVAAQAISAIRKLVEQMPDWEGLNAELMPISAAPGLRVAKLKLLKTLGQRPRIHDAQRTFFLSKLEEDLFPDEKLVTRSIVKYLKLRGRKSET